MLRFAPSRVEGMDNVIEVVVHVDRLELHAPSEERVIRFVDIAQWPSPRWLWRWLKRRGLTRRGGLIGERDWFHPPAERFIRVYSSPSITIYMPNEVGVTYHDTVFHRSQVIMAIGGYSTFDLG